MKTNEQPLVWPAAIDCWLVNSIVEQRNPSCLEDLKPQHYRNGGACEHQPTLPLVLVTECTEVLEGWFGCEGVPEETLQAFFNRSLKMGGGAGLWEPHRKALVPGGAGVNGYKAIIESYNVPAANEQPLAHNDHREVR
jgi:hypothetical protein